MNKIIENKAKCRKCQNIVTSVHRHDFSCCACGALCVDGGKAYLRRVGSPEDCEELSVFGEEEVDDYTQVHRDYMNE